MVEFGWKLDKNSLEKSVCKLLGVAETNQRMLDCAHYPYIMEIVNIPKQAELTKNNKLHSSIVYRRQQWWTKGLATIYFCII